VDAARGGPPVGGADIHYDSTVPVGGGLSSSAALQVVTALALTELHGVELPRQELALLCQRSENVYVGAPVGVMDQTASACCTRATRCTWTYGLWRSVRCRSTCGGGRCAAGPYSHFPYDLRV